MNIKIINIPDRIDDGSHTIMSRFVLGLPEHRVIHVCLNLNIYLSIGMHSFNISLILDIAYFTLWLAYSQLYSRLQDPLRLVRTTVQLLDMGSSEIQFRKTQIKVEVQHHATCNIFYYPKATGPHSLDSYMLILQFLYFRTNHNNAVTVFCI